MLKNYNEVAVQALLKKVVDDYKKENPGICTCELCLEDVAAVALNFLPPHYVVTEKGQIYTNVAFEQIGKKAEVIAAITNALAVISQNPRHKKAIED